jgi:hypothetical protein
MRYSRFVVLLVTPLALATACSGSAGSTSAAPVAQASSTHPSTPISDPCRLLTPAEASPAVGQVLVRSDVQHYGPVTRCRFFNAGGDEPIWLDVTDASTFDGLAHLPDVKPVSGIGDQALWQHNELATFVHILKDGNTVSMGLPRTLSSMTRAVESAAKLVASRM